MGTPVFAYKVRGITDSVINGKTGILVDRGDYRQIAIEIIKLFNDPERYDQFSKNCKKWSEKYSWEESTRESTLLIDSL